MRFDILTIFPPLFESPLREGIIRRALRQGKITVEIHDIRDFATDKHSMTDDRPFGGGEGMVMKPEPIAAALKRVREEVPSTRVVLLTPQGRPYTQKVAEELAGVEELTLVCGRYEGVDERIRAHYVDDEISIGDYVLTGGELAAMVMIDSITRLLPGVLGCEDSATRDTFSRSLLKNHQYTRPRVFEGHEVPEVLFSGDHQAIADYRWLNSVRLTLERRVDLLPGLELTDREKKVLVENGLYDAVKAQAGGA